MLTTSWILFIVFGLISFRTLSIEFFGKGLTYLGFSILFIATIISAICAGIIFDDLHISFLGV